MYVDYLANAIERAQRIQQKRKARNMPPIFKYIVQEGLDYCVCNESELDTFYLGSPVIAEIGPDGLIVE